jgi:putative flippase GtrA
MRERVHRLLVAPTGDTHIQFLRYLIVGGLAFGVDFGTLWGLSSGLGIHYLVSAAIAFLLGLAVNYLLSTVWVFSQRRMLDRRREFFVFAGIGVLGLGLNELGLWILAGGVGLDYRIAKLFTTGVVFAWNFIARKVVLFSDKIV